MKIPAFPINGGIPTVKRTDTPAFKVATQPQRKQANGRVVVRNGVRTVLRHDAYHPRQPVVSTQIKEVIGTPIGYNAKRAAIFGR